MSKETSFSEQERKEFYERFGSAHFKLQSDVSREYSKHIIDIYFKSVSFAGTVVGTIGIIAGFGFTALSSVESPTLFFIGEGLLIYSILHGLIWIQNVYKGEFDSMDTANRKHQTYFSERNEKFISLWDELSKTGKVKEDDFKAFAELNAKASQLFTPPKESLDKSSKNMKEIFSKKLYYFMITGTICLLTSFFVYSFLGFIFCFDIHF